MKKLIALIAVVPFVFAGVASAAPATPQGSLETTVSENSVTINYEFSGVKRSNWVRVSAQCQLPNSGVPWAQAVTATTSPGSVTFTDFPDGLKCRSDIFAVSPSLNITYLDYEVWYS
jgi:hypothetical protein